MHKPKLIFKILFFLLTCGLTNAFAQTENKTPAPEANYDVVLQILVASEGQTDKNALPSNLSNVVKKLKGNYNFSNYRLVSTYLQRIANAGGVELKSVLNAAEADRTNFAPVFTEWSLGRLFSLSGNALQIQSFRFGQKIPVKTAGFKDGNGQMTPVINYEHVGLSMQKVGLSENTPTVVGSLSTSNPDELMFLVLTVKTAEQ